MIVDGSRMVPMSAGTAYISGFFENSTIVHSLDVVEELLTHVTAITLHTPLAANATLSLQESSVQRIVMTLTFSNGLVMPDLEPSDFLSIGILNLTSSEPGIVSINSTGWLTQHRALVVHVSEV